MKMNPWRNFLDKWKRIMMMVGDFQMNLIFSTLYYLLVTPVGLVVGIFNDYLDKEGLPKWHQMHNKLDEIISMKEQ